MGTRNLTFVVKNGEFRVAQYCQWDGYPGGQGTTIFDFITEEMTPQFTEQIDRIKHLTPDEVMARWSANGADGSGMVNMQVADKFKISNAHLDRDMGALILSYIQNAERPEVSMDINFASDSLFCEWAYVLDLDNEVLEVYKGFNEQPLASKERFKFLELTREAYHNGKPNKYFPISCVAKFSFANLRSDFESSGEWAAHINRLINEGDE